MVLYESFIYSSIHLGYQFEVLTAGLTKGHYNITERTEKPSVIPDIYQVDRMVLWYDYMHGVHSKSEQDQGIVP